MTKTILQNILVALELSGLLISQNCEAQSPSHTNTELGDSINNAGSFNLFENPDKPIVIFIEAPLAKIAGTQKPTTNKNELKFQGRLKIRLDSSKGKATYSSPANIEITPRGGHRFYNNFLKPLEIDIVSKKSETPLVFSKEWRSFDLVNPRFVGSSKPENNFNQEIFAEFISYRLANFMLPFSLRVQLVKIEILDRNKLKSIGYGIIRESKTAAAKRLGMAKIPKEQGIVTQYLEIENHRDNYDVALFQNLIQNRDHIPKLLKNYLGLRRDDASIVLIPYDFDYTKFFSFSNAKTMVPLMNFSTQKNRLASDTLDYLSFRIRNEPEKDIIAILHEFDQHIIEVRRRLSDFESALSTSPASEALRIYTKDSLRQFDSILLELTSPLHIDFSPNERESLWRNPTCSSELFMKLLELIPPEAHWSAIHEFMASHADHFSKNSSVKDILQIYSSDPSRSFLIGRLVMASPEKLLKISTEREGIALLSTYISDLLSQWPLYTSEIERDALWLFKERLDGLLAPK